MIGSSGRALHRNSFAPLLKAPLNFDISYKDKRHLDQEISTKFFLSVLSSLLLSCQILKFHLFKILRPSAKGAPATVEKHFYSLNYSTINKVDSAYLSLDRRLN
jgi:hypothetical protein